MSCTYMHLACISWVELGWDGWTIDGEAFFYPYFLFLFMTGMISILASK